MKRKDGQKQDRISYEIRLLTDAIIGNLRWFKDNTSFDAQEKAKTLERLAEQRGMLVEAQNHNEIKRILRKKEKTNDYKE